MESWIAIRDWEKRDHAIEGLLLDFWRLTHAWRKCEVFRAFIRRRDIHDLAIEKGSYGYHQLTLKKNGSILRTKVKVLKIKKARLDIGKWEEKKVWSFLGESYVFFNFLNILIMIIFSSFYSFSLLLEYSNFICFGMNNEGHFDYC